LLASPKKVHLFLFPKIWFFCVLVKWRKTWNHNRRKKKEIKEGDGEGKIIEEKKEKKIIIIIIIIKGGRRRGKLDFVMHFLLSKKHMCNIVYYLVLIKKHFCICLVKFVLCLPFKKIQQCWRNSLHKSCNA
jgi:hypothetical protein